MSASISFDIASIVFLLAFYIFILIYRILLTCRFSMSGTLFTAIQAILFCLVQIFSVTLRLATVVTHCRCSIFDFILDRFVVMIITFLYNIITDSKGFKIAVHLWFILRKFILPKANVGFTL